MSAIFASPINIQTFAAGWESLGRLAYSPELVKADRFLSLAPAKIFAEVGYNCVFLCEMLISVLD